MTELEQRTGTPVGSAGVVVRLGRPSDARSFLEAFRSVAEERRSSHRGRGIGAELLKEAVAWAERVGVRRVELTVYPHNDRARALYRKFGFVEEGRLARHAKKSYGYEDEILMALWLGPTP